MKMNKTLKTAAMTLAILSICGAGAFAQAAAEPAEPAIEVANQKQVIIITGKVNVKKNGAITLKAGNKKTYKVNIADAEAVTPEALAAYKGKLVVLQAIVDNDAYVVDVYAIGYPDTYVQTSGIEK